MSVRSVLSAGDISVNKLNLHCTGRHDKHYIASWKTFGKTGAREGALVVLGMGMGATFYVGKWGRPL